MLDTNMAQKILSIKFAKLNLSLAEKLTNEESILKDIWSMHVGVGDFIFKSFLLVLKMVALIPVDSIINFQKCQCELKSFEMKPLYSLMCSRKR